MEDKIYDLIKSWAGISTWHTPHPSDQKRFSIAMNNLVSELGENVDIDAFERALRRHAESHVAILGAPEHWDNAISRFVSKAETIFDYESVR